MIDFSKVKLSTIKMVGKMDGALQLCINGIPLFMEGTYLDGKPYKSPVIVTNYKLRKLRLIVSSQEEFPFKIRNFKYNGFMGLKLKGCAKYKASFIKWSGDPGVAIMKCSDNKERYIPTYAIYGKVLLPKDETKREDKILFGQESHS